MVSPAPYFKGKGKAATRVRGNPRERESPKEKARAGRKGIIMPKARGLVSKANRKASTRKESVSPKATHSI